MSGMDDSEFKKKNEKKQKKERYGKKEGVQILFYLIVFFF